MDATKVGKFIKDLRKKNNLTQKELGNKYNVTYQAVSKWERGINMPDVSLLREMSKDFNVSLEDILDGEVKDVDEEKKINVKEARLIYPYVFGVIGFVFIGLLVALMFLNTKPKTSFSFKTLSSCFTSNKILLSFSIFAKMSLFLNRELELLILSIKSTLELLSYFFEFFKIQG